MRYGVSLQRVGVSPEQRWRRTSDYSCLPPREEVPISYESRISKLSLNAAELPKLDAEFEEITEGEELTKKEKLKTKWAALEALVGDPQRIALVAAGLVADFKKGVEAMIVCMSRRIAVDLYDALTIPAGQVKRRSLSGAADMLARSASAPLQQNVPKSILYPSSFIPVLAGLLGQCL